jgi:hypothetical protein
MKELTASCEVCHNNILPIEDGFLYCTLSDIYVHERIRKEFEDKIRKREETEKFVVLSLSDLPEAEQAKWHVLHNDCAATDTGWYWFDMGKGFSYHSLLDWTAHLMGKNWLEDTDWENLIRRAANHGELRTWERR